MPKSTDITAAKAAFTVLFMCLNASGVAAYAQESESQAGPVAAEPETVATIPVAEISRPEPAAQSAGGEAVHLEDVVVTATKREKSLRDIPASIDSFDGEKLEAQGKLSLSDFLEQKPGVAMDEISPGLIRISVRGISTDANPVSPLPSATGIFIGDTAFSDPYISNIQPDMSAFDLASVELLKGPQGTLFGGAALAGAVRYLLQDPVMGQWQVRGFTQYVSPNGGSHALTSGAALDVPLYSDSLALRLGYVKRNYPGITDINRNPRLENVDTGSGQQLRGILSWRPLDALGIKLTHLQQDYATPNAATTADTRDQRENNKRVLPQPTNSDFSLDSLELGYDFGPVRAVSLTSRNHKNWYLLADATAAVAGQPAPNYPPELGAFEIINDQSKSLAQEFRLQSTGKDGLQWLVGVYLYNYKVFFDLFIDTIPQQQLLGNGSVIGSLLNGVNIGSSSLYNDTSILYAVSNVTARERAVFFDLSEKFWDRLELSAGARLYKTQVKGGFFGTGILAKAENGGMDIHYENNNIEERGINPKLAAIWHFSQEISAYAQAAKGFRFGGLQSVPSTPANNVPAVYKSDNLWNYEAGLRTSWLDNTLHLDGTVFYIDYKNPQIVQTTTGIPLNYTANVGAAISRGVEASMIWLTPFNGLSVELAGGLTDAHITVPFTAADGTPVPAGAKMPGAAASQYAVALGYAAPQIGIFNAGARVDYSYLGKGYGDITQVHTINDYGTLNVGFTLSTLEWALKPQLALNVSNVLDVTAAKYGATSKPLVGASYDTYLLNQPRTITIRLGLEF